MIKETIKYTDFDGNENEETLYFNLTRAELTKLELGGKNGLLSDYIKGAVESGDNYALVEVFNKILLESYGIKSEDGKRFIKSAKIKEEFEQTAAFSEMFMKLLTNPDAAEAFVKSLAVQ